MSLKFENALVLVTGAASGIGRALALAFARKGARLLLVDLNLAGAEETAEQVRAAKGEAQAYQTDVADFEQMKALADTIEADAGPLDILCNNAGVAIGGDFQSTTIEDWNWIVSINLMGVVHGIHAFLPGMRAHGRGGHILNTASTAGLVAPAFIPAYAATKFAVVGLSESLRGELARERIGVSALCPGFVNTPIVRATRLVGEQPENAHEKFARMYARRNLSADTVAKIALAGIRDNRAVIPVGAEAHLSHLTKRLLPGGWDRLNRFNLNRIGQKAK